MERKPKAKSCRVCKAEFIPRATTQVVCSYDCSYTYVGWQKQKERKAKSKAWIKRKRELKESLKTKSDYIKELQKVFNTYIRLRDQGLSCISCSRIMDPKLRKYDAGHYYSVGQYPSVRFNPNNVHAQCVECNQYRHGNIHEYGKNIINRIGLEAYKQLDVKKNSPARYSIPDLKALILEYKKKVKKLRNGME
jgi:hypothetical protein